MLSPFPRVPTPHRRRVTVVTRLCDRGRPICHFYAIAGMRHPGPLTAIDYWRRGSHWPRHNGPIGRRR